MKHFNRLSYKRKGDFIILDGHLSLTNLAVVDLCEASEIELVLIPPHTSYALQPLDAFFLNH